MGQSWEPHYLVCQSRFSAVLSQISPMFAAGNSSEASVEIFSETVLLETGGFSKPGFPMTSPSLLILPLHLLMTKVIPKDIGLEQVTFGSLSRNAPMCTEEEACFLRTFSNGSSVPEIKYGLFWSESSEVGHVSLGWDKSGPFSEPQGVENRAPNWWFGQSGVAYRPEAYSKKLPLKIPRISENNQKPFALGANPEKSDLRDTKPIPMGPRMRERECPVNSMCSRFY